MPSFDGQTIAGCRLVRKIGEGGMGVVYEALEEASNRRAAVKLLHPSISIDREVALRFRNEAQVLKNIFEAESKYYISMKVGLLAHISGYAPAIAIEFARKALMSEVRPSFTEIDEATSNLPSLA